LTLQVGECIIVTSNHQGHIMKKASKEKLLECLKTDVKLWNRYRRFTKYKAVDLQDADMRDANMQDADMRDANMRGANMQDADMRDANMRGADLQDANMRSADMRGADMRSANMRYADMRDANMQDADMRSADLDYTSITFQCASIGLKCDERLILQSLYHVARYEYVGNDKDIEELLSSDLYKKVANKFHRVDECGALQ